MTRTHIAARLWVVLSVLNLAATPALAQEKVIHSFASTPDGEQPWAGVIADASGNLYGTTGQAGVWGAGMVFELSPAAGGAWVLKDLHDFCSAPGGNCLDGDWPVGNLVFDSLGNLYGTTAGGGANTSPAGAGAGVVFELSPRANGAWVEAVLYNFCSQPGCSDGWAPKSDLVLDPQGDLYGTTSCSGTSSTCAGIVFELSHASGQWVETVLYTFCSRVKCFDGQAVNGQIVLSGGHIFGTTQSGGLHNAGTVWELSPTGSGAWAETVIYPFCSNQPNCFDGATPAAGVTMDSQGRLFGTTLAGGVKGDGTVFALTPSGSSWSEGVLHAFGTVAADGIGPASRVALDAYGHVFGTTPAGGANAPGRNNYGGTLFELTPGTPWTESILYNFCSLANCVDGEYPLGNVYLLGGNLFGTTFYGGAHGLFGTVWEFVR
jgi:uncharacterized repeat protein (TIGR03803 family)